MLVEKTAAFGLGGGKWQDYRDQRSNQSPAERGKSGEGRERERVGEFAGESYRKVFLHRAYRALRW